jgi:hypothetical protein
MSMSPEIEKEYRAALARVVAAKGFVVKEHPSFYWWIDYEASEHLGLRDSGAGCMVIVPVTARGREDEWEEFEGTFYEGDTTHHGATVDGISCACGLLTNRSLRWEASVHEVAEAVFVEALGARPAVA